MVVMVIEFKPFPKTCSDTHLRAKKVLHYVKQGIFREVATDTNTKRIKKTGHAHEADQA